MLKIPMLQIQIHQWCIGGCARDLHRTWHSSDTSQCQLNAKERENVWNKLKSTVMFTKENLVVNSFEWILHFFNFWNFWYDFRLSLAPLVALGESWKEPSSNSGQFDFQPSNQWYSTKPCFYTLDAGRYWRHVWANLRQIKLEIH